MLLPGRVSPNQDHQLDLQAGISFCRSKYRHLADASRRGSGGYEIWSHASDLPATCVSICGNSHTDDANLHHEFTVDGLVSVEEHFQHTI